MTNSECVFFHNKDAREIFKQTTTIKQNTSSDFFLRWDWTVGGEGE